MAEVLLALTAAQGAGFAVISGAPARLTFVPAARVVDERLAALELDGPREVDARDILIDDWRAARAVIDADPAGTRRTAERFGRTMDAADAALARLVVAGSDDLQVRLAAIATVGSSRRGRRSSVIWGAPSTR